MKNAITLLAALLSTAAYAQNAEETTLAVEQVSTEEKDQNELQLLSLTEETTNETVAQLCCGDCSDNDKK